MRHDETGRPGEPGRPWRVLLDARWLVFTVVTVVAAFSFIVSYSHIYDLGRTHAQSGTAARLLPLTVDLLIVGASLVLFIQARAKPKAWALAWWLPRAVLYAAIGATVAANVAYGLPSGWLSAVISGWPGAAFVAAVELGILVARPVTAADTGESQTGRVGPPAHAATKPVSLPRHREIQDRQGCGPATAKKIRAEIKRDRALTNPPAGVMDYLATTPAPAGDLAPSNGHHA